MTIVNGKRGRASIRFGRVSISFSVPRIADEIVHANKLKMSDVIRGYYGLMEEGWPLWKHRKVADVLHHFETALARKADRLNSEYDPEWWLIMNELRRINHAYTVKPLPEFTVSP